MLFTSEQVSDGHPDKICDQISDAIVTDCLKHDPYSRVAVECMIKENIIIIAGEITSLHSPNYQELAREVLKRIGLSDIEDYHITILITCQSPDIAMGVDQAGAGDQGMMFGYATDETPELLPLPYVLATRALAHLKAQKCNFLLPDAKSQVTFDYENHRIDTFLISTQHTEGASTKAVYHAAKRAMEMAAAEYDLNTDFKILVNPTGRFVNGGSFADTGVTGRKIIADTYGGVCRHGGGAFSGKDPTKVDRSGAYMARKIACDLIRKGYAKRCEVQLSYAIGIAEPVSITVDCFGTEEIPIANLTDYVRNKYDLTPNGIIRSLDLVNVDYNSVSSYGHFGKGWLPWEQ